MEIEDLDGLYLFIYSLDWLILQHMSQDVIFRLFHILVGLGLLMSKRDSTQVECHCKVCGPNVGTSKSTDNLAVGSDWGLENYKRELSEILSP